MQLSWKHKQAFGIQRLQSNHIKTSLHEVNIVGPKVKIAHLQMLLASDFKEPMELDSNMLKNGNSKKTSQIRKATSE